MRASLPFFKAATPLKCNILPPRQLILLNIHFFLFLQRLQNATIQDVQAIIL